MPAAHIELKADKLRVLSRVDRRIVASGEATLDLDDKGLKLVGKLRADEGLIDFTRGDAPALADDVSVRRGPREAAPIDPAAPPAPKAARNSTVDIALDFYAINHPGIDTMPLARERLCVLAPPRFALNHPDPLSRLAELPLIGLVGNDPIVTMLSQVGSQLGFEPQTRVQVQTSQLAESLVARGLGWAVVDSVTARNMVPGKVRVIEFRSEIECPLNAFVVRNSAPTIQARGFLERVHARLREMASTAPGRD